MRQKFEYFIDHFLEYDLLTLAAALSFYTALALAPLLLITLYGLGTLGDEAMTYFLNQTTIVIGQQPAKAIELIVKSIQARPDLSQIGGIIGIITLFFSASGAFAQLQFSMNKIWSSEHNEKSGIKDWLERRLLSFGMVLTLIIISAASLLVSTAMNYIFSFNNLTWAVLNHTLTFLGTCAIFTALIRYLPDTHIPWIPSMRGGIATALLFTLGKYLIGLYLGRSALNSAYGAAGSLIVFLTWFYYSSLIIFVGALYARTMCQFSEADSSLEACE